MEIQIKTFRVEIKFKWFPIYAKINSDSRKVTMSKKLYTKLKIALNFIIKVLTFR